MDTDNADQIAYWNEKAGQTWTAFQERLDALFTPVTQAAVDAAAPAPGEHAIDIGCGCGATVLELARRVGAEGQVLGLDVSEPMTARATERIGQAGLAQARVVVADASSYAFTGDADLLFSRFGVMFFADPAAAFAHLHTALRPGGRLLCAVWRPMAENSWFTVPLDAARPLLPPQPSSEPDAPGPFAFADADRVSRILATAGWRDAQLARHDVEMRLAGPGGLDQATEFVTRIGALARLLAEADAELRARVKQVVSAALAEREGPDGITLGGSIWLMSART